MARMKPPDRDLAHHAAGRVYWPNLGCSRPVHDAERDPAPRAIDALADEGHQHQRQQQQREQEQSGRPLLPAAHASELVSVIEQLIIDGWHASWNCGTDPSHFQLLALVKTVWPLTRTFALLTW